MVHDQRIPPIARKQSSKTRKPPMIRGGIPENIILASAGIGRAQIPHLCPPTTLTPGNTNPMVPLFSLTFPRPRRTKFAHVPRSIILIRALIVRFPRPLGGPCFVVPTLIGLHCVPPLFVLALVSNGSRVSFVGHSRSPGT